MDKVLVFKGDGGESILNLIHGLHLSGGIWQISVLEVGSGSLKE